MKTVESTYRQSSAIYKTSGKTIFLVKPSQLDGRTAMHDAL